MQSFIQRACQKCRILFITPMQNFRLMASNSAATLSDNTEVLRQMGFSEIESEIALSKPSIASANTRRLKNVTDILQRLGFTTQDVLKRTSVLTLFPGTIDHRYKILEESGFFPEKITLDVILQFTKYLSKNIRELKMKGFIDGNIDPIRNILSYSDLPPDLLPPHMDESLTFGISQTVAIQTYLGWKLSLKKEEVERRFKTYRILHYKSIRLIMESYDVLINNIGMSKEKIKQNTYVLHSHPSNFLDILERIPMVGESSIRSVAKMHPRLLLRSADTMLEILQILEEYKIPKKSPSLNVNILTLSPTTVRERLQHLHSDPYFKPYFYNPRICSFVIYYDKVTNRSKLLSESKWRCHSLDMLSAETRVFNSRFLLGADETIGNDLVHYLTKELKMKCTDVRHILRQHPFWRFVPLMTVTSTLQYLQKTGFNRTQIIDALPVILYPKSEVDRQLTLLESQPEVECCRDPLSGQVRSDLTLQLLLYYMERPYHFTGNGVWLDNSDHSDPLEFSRKSIDVH